MTIIWNPEGLSLNAEELERIQHPYSAGLIYFSRNYESPQQVLRMTQQARKHRQDMIISVDQEGGKVQRFIGNGFTQLPAPADIHSLYKTDAIAGKRFAKLSANISAAELAQCGINVNYAPVLDVVRHSKQLLGGTGGRTFGEDPESVVELARLYSEELIAGGVACIGKHFPGHGAVVEDSHKVLPQDLRSKEEIQKDMQTFIRCQDVLSGMMSAHVVYSAIDDAPASFSSVWLKNILREEIGFEGAVIADDLTMGAVEQTYGSIEEAAEKAIEAGNDMLLICNQQDKIKRAMRHLEKINAPLPSRTVRYVRAPTPPLDTLNDWKQELEEIQNKMRK